MMWTNFVIGLKIKNTNLLLQLCPYLPRLASSQWPFHYQRLKLLCPHIGLVLITILHSRREYFPSKRVFAPVGFRNITSKLQPCYFSKEKGGHLVLLSAFSALNQATILDKYPITVIEELQGTNLFYKINLKDGYTQIHMHAADVPKPSFRTHQVSYDLQVQDECVWIDQHACYLPMCYEFHILAIFAQICVGILDDTVTYDTNVYIIWRWFWATVCWLSVYHLCEIAKLVYILNCGKNSETANLYNFAMCCGSCYLL